MNSRPTAHKNAKVSTALWIGKLKSYLFRGQVPISLLLEGQFLVDTEKMFALLWTPKAGSLFAVRWFFKQRGLLKEAVAYNKFVHKYREDVYRYSEEHRKSLNAYMRNPDDFSVIKIVRHPLKRAASSFIHANKRGYSDRKISKVIGRKLSAENRFSFKEFICYLATVNIYACNVHYRAQLHSLEKSGKIKVDHVIDLEDSIVKLSKLEKELGLKVTNLDQFSKSGHHTTRVEMEGFYGDTIDFYGQKGVLIPYAKSFYDDDLVTRVGSIYADDFAQYGYLCSLADI
jgi:hypothetical protein